MAKIKVQHTKFRVDDGEGTMMDIEQLDELTGLGSGSASEIPTTDFDSTGMEFEPGLKDEGSLTLSLVYDPDLPSHERLEDIRDNQETAEFELELVNGRKYSFLAFVTTFTKDLATNDILRGSVNLRITGSVTRTPAV